MHSRTEFSPIPLFYQAIREKDPGTYETVVAEKENPAAEIVFITANRLSIQSPYLLPRIRKYILNINQIVICAPEFMVWTLLFQILCIQGGNI
ncbi:MAG: hypothetical protein PVG08_01130 [Desulfobacterales bacterium]